MELLSRSKTGKKERPIKVLQFGEGNFLRGFVDYMIDIANEKGEFDGDIVLVKPIEFGTLDRFRSQECQYTVSLRGIVDGKPAVLNRIVTSVADVVAAHEEYEKYSSYAKLDTLRYIVSNTTEAGIVYDESDKLEMNPPKSFPAKLAKFLYERYQYFNGAMDKGLVMLPVELIDDNGIHLKECVLKQADNWNLEDSFKKWVNEACIFTSTLVDRIITGYPREEDKKLWEEWGYRDELIVTGEPFALWVIESEKDIRGEFPLDKAGLPVIFTDNQKPYKQRKVRILNGAHTSFVLASYLAGNDTVLESMKDELIYKFMRSTIFDEVIPTLSLPEKDLVDFAEAVTTRFNNPYVKHALLSISLNSVSKWRARCMPSFLGYIDKTGTLPKHLTFSLAALMAFYQGTEIRDKALIGHRNGEEYNIMDDDAVLKYFAANSTKPSKEFAHGFLSNTAFFGQNLTQIEGLEDTVAAYLDEIANKGMRKTMEDNFRS
ncbi:MAG: tagaturonate reductase [Lachnospiraceae bacterium]|nr:tagaturonate reductase [Lachnospiraceae bacterium]